MTLTCGGPPACQGVCVGSGAPLPSGCGVDWVPASTPTACDAVCSAVGRQCTPSCAPPTTSPVAAVVALYKSTSGATQYGDTPDCTSVPPVQQSDGLTTWTYVDQSCCCY